MSANTPRTDDVARMPTDAYPTWVVPGAFSRELEIELNTWKARYESLHGIRCNLDIKLSEANRELSDLRSQLTEIQSTCDHDWEHVYDSFDHEFGTEVIRFDRCLKCGKTKEWEDAETDCDDGPAERPLTPLENYQRNDEHNVP